MRTFRFLTPFVVAMLVLTACPAGDGDGSGGDGGGEGGFVFQGPDGALNTQFGNGGDCLFTDPPGCYLHHQASFMAGPSGFFETNFPDVAVSGETYDFFSMPPIEKSQPTARECDNVSGWHSRLRMSRLS